MPIRIACPSCSASLSIKDELAGRAFQCPKCGGVIPASQSASPSAAPTPTPGEPVKSGSKVMGQPAPRAKNVDEDEEDRPRRKKSDDRRGSGGTRGGFPPQEDEEKEDRPTKNRKKRGDDDEDDHSTRGKKKGGGVGLILAIVGGLLLVCCLGVGGVGYYIYTLVMKGAEEVRKELDKVDKQNPPANSEPAIEVKAEDLAKVYKDDKAGADSKYKGKIVFVEGILEDMDFLPFGDVYARLKGAGGNQIRCVVVKKDVNRLIDTSRGQTLQLKGKCDGLNAIFVDVLDATIEGLGPDPGLNATAAGLINEFGRDSVATNAKYNDKPIIITNAVVDSKPGEATIIVRGVKQTGKTKIKVTLPWDSRDQIAKLKPGDLVKAIRGEYAGSSDDLIYVNRGRIVP